MMSLSHLGGSARDTTQTQTVAAAVIGKNQALPRTYASVLRVNCFVNRTLTTALYQSLSSPFEDK